MSWTAPREIRRFDGHYQVVDVPDAVELFRDSLPDGAQIMSIIRWERRDRIETTSYGQEVAQYIDGALGVWADVSVLVEECDFCDEATIVGDVKDCGCPPNRKERP